MSASSIPVQVVNNTLIFSNNAKVTFHRTLRIPQDNKVYALPPSLGTFPIHKVDDYKDKVPASWRAHGGVFIPMFQSEAMWLQFSADQYAPKAVKIGIGKVNAINGKPWSNTLQGNQNASFFSAEQIQDYAVIPLQPWIDGINNADYVKQFIAEPLGSGLTVEAQVTGKEEVGGMQLMMFDPKVPLQRPVVNRSFGRMKKSSHNFAAQEESLCDSLSYAECESFSAAACSAPIMSKSRSEPTKAMEMGLGAGGNIKQKIYSDPYGGAHFWNENNYQRIFVHIVNSEMYYQITGKRLTGTVNASTYKRYGYPWYSIYDEHVPHVKASPILANVQSVQQIQQQQWQQQFNHVPQYHVQQQNWPLADHQLNKKNVVRDGAW